MQHATEWLREQGYDPETILNFENVFRTPKIHQASDENAIEVCLRMWLHDHG